MGVFIACWLPFFVTNLLSAFCQSCIHNPERVVTVVTWLGWINSGMNPVIYACWSRDFRRYYDVYVIFLNTERRSLARKLLSFNPNIFLVKFTSRLNNSFLKGREMEWVIQRELRESRFDWHLHN
jgi:hypothetical protein